jgi:hypothetical protein
MKIKLVTLKGMAPYSVNKYHWESSMLVIQLRAEAPIGPQDMAKELHLSQLPRITLDARLDAASLYRLLLNHVSQDERDHRAVLKWLIRMAPEDAQEHRWSSIEDYIAKLKEIMRGLESEIYAARQQPKRQGEHYESDFD